jgi:hypothetical protein
LWAAVLPSSCHLRQAALQDPLPPGMFQPPSGRSLGSSSSYRSSSWVDQYPPPPAIIQLPSGLPPPLPVGLRNGQTSMRYCWGHLTRLLGDHRDRHLVENSSSIHCGWGRFNSFLGGVGGLPSSRHFSQGVCQRPLPPGMPQPPFRGAVGIVISPRGLPALTTTWDVALTFWAAATTLPSYRFLLRAAWYPPPPVHRPSWWLEGEPNSTPFNTTLHLQPRSMLSRSKASQSLSIVSGSSKYTTRSIC